MEVSKIAILGASYLQKPLIVKANEMGLQTHVFAWREGNVVEDLCYRFYDISILNKEAILNECKKIGIKGIISIASDAAMPTVNYIANKLGLVGNSINSTLISTDKYEMRSAILRAGLSCPKFKLYKEPNFVCDKSMSFPLIVKPTDRSGSRGVWKVDRKEDVNLAIKKALLESFNKRVIVEEFIEGNEYSVEMLSYQGRHYHLAVTEKNTTGPPFFVEKRHIQPANITSQLEIIIENEVKRALNALGLKNGASHTEIIIDKDGLPKIVEIAGRMGGDFIGSHLVRLTTGFDYLKATIEVAMGVFEGEMCIHNLKKQIGCVDYLIPPPGVIAHVHIDAQKHSNIEHFEMLKKIGEKIEFPIDSSNKRCAVMVCAIDSYEIGKIIEEVVKIDSGNI